MEEKDIIEMWKNYSARLRDELTIDRVVVKDIKLTKARTELNWLLGQRVVEAIIFLVLFLWLVGFIGNNFPVLHFVAAGFILMVFSLIGLIGNLLQIGQIRQLDYAQPVTAFQEHLQRLQAYNLQTLRLVFLSVPFYFAYIIIGFRAFFGLDIYANANPNWLIANLLLSILLIPAVIWLYKKLSYRSQKNWVKKLIEDNGGKRIRSALQFLEEIDQFKKESQVEL